MKLPNEVAPGQQISAKDYNLLLRYLRSLTPRGSPGVWVTQSMNGTSIKLAPNDSTGVGGPVIIVHPFLVSNASAGTAANVTVQSGSVNDVIPTGIAPTLQSLTSAGTWRVYLDCTVDASGTVTAVAVGVVNGEQPANSPAHAYITLATVAVGAITGGFSVTSISQLATHSLRFEACGRDSGNPDSTPGAYNFWGF